MMPAAMALSSLSPLGREESGEPEKVGVTEDVGVMEDVSGTAVATELDVSDVTA